MQDTKIFPPNRVTVLQRQQLWVHEPRGVHVVQLLTDAHYGGANTNVGGHSPHTSLYVTHPENGHIRRDPKQVRRGAEKELQGVLQGWRCIFRTRGVVAQHQEHTKRHFQTMSVL